ncbi:sterol desaturase family protein [Nitratireductor mangrovi]|uniref:Sterol desaturase family protein n=1 Tax=Nitratireductor mangrovi TaxID=2599600 RepID=A0A5B8KXS9_9HYPH|nr:sterol desaturase family protein [Nitratireductor mangrovi]QDZ00280.1 sterol desaturase family protein [Nitratireductor mangrovi]
MDGQTVADMMLAYLGRLVDHIASAEVLGYALLASALLVAVDFVRRGFRIVWPWRKIESVLATAAIYGVNLLFGPYVLLLAKLLEDAYKATGIPHVDPFFWQGVPAWLLIPFAVFMFDIANYWSHRLMHMKWLWPIHAIHHSDPEVNGLTTYRVHVFEPLVMLTVYTVLLGWLGLPAGVLGGAAVFLGLLNFYVHVNVDWGHGPFRLLLASPRFHRWHHADVPEAYGKNLANVFPFLDVAFGTYYVPGTCRAEVGAEGVPKNDVVRLVLFPFVEWGRMVRDAIRAGRAGEGASETSDVPPLEGTSSAQ